MHLWNRRRRSIPALLRSSLSNKHLMNEKDKWCDACWWWEFWSSLNYSENESTFHWRSEFIRIVNEIRFQPRDSIWDNRRAVCGGFHSILRNHSSAIQRSGRDEGLVPWKTWPLDFLVDNSPSISLYDLQTNHSIWEISLSESLWQTGRFLEA